MLRPEPHPPGPGQESVWDYPRPPRLEESDELVVVELAGTVIVRSRRSLRLLERGHPPTYYLPMDDVTAGTLAPARGRSYCEFKGTARPFDVSSGEVVARRGAWHYPNPSRDFDRLADHVAFYVGAMDRCFVDGEVARPQPGRYYGGWVTSRVVGPFKGEPGSLLW